MNGKSDDMMDNERKIGMAEEIRRDNNNKKR